MFVTLITKSSAVSPDFATDGGRLVNGPELIGVMLTLTSEARETSSPRNEVMGASSSSGRKILGLSVDCENPIVPEKVDGRVIPVIRTSVDEICSITGVPLNMNRP